MYDLLIILSVSLCIERSTTSFRRACESIMTMTMSLSCLSNITPIGASHARRAKNVIIMVHARIVSATLHTTAVNLACHRVPA